MLGCVVSPDATSPADKEPEPGDSGEGEPGDTADAAVDLAVHMTMTGSFEAAVKV